MLPLSKHHRSPPLLPQEPLCPFSLSHSEIAPLSLPLLSTSLLFACFFLLPHSAVCWNWHPQFTHPRPSQSRQLRCGGDGRGVVQPAVAGWRNGCQARGVQMLAKAVSSQASSLAACNMHRKSFSHWKSQAAPEGAAHSSSPLAGVPSGIALCSGDGRAGRSPGILLLTAGFVAPAGLKPPSA